MIPVFDICTAEQPFFYLYGSAQFIAMNLLTLTFTDIHDAPDNFYIFTFVCKTQLQGHNTNVEITSLHCCLYYPACLVVQDVTTLATYIQYIVFKYAGFVSMEMA